jgi:hypothetical protein
MVPIRGGGDSTDLRRVRLHTDEVAGKAARAIRARAFAIGEDIFFAPGAFEPDSASGRELLAHELTRLGCVRTRAATRAYRARPARVRVQCHPRPLRRLVAVRQGTALRSSPEPG